MSNYLSLLRIILIDDKIKVTFRDNSANNRIKFENALRNYDWSLLKHENLNNYVENFLSKLNSFYCKYFPLKTKFISSRKFHNPWYTPDIKKLIEAKSKYFKLLRLGIVSNFENNKFKNKIKSIIAKSKSSYYESLFNRNRSNMRKTWSIIKSITTCNASIDSSQNLLFNNIEYSDEFSVANLFNEYFCDIETTLEHDLAPSTADLYTYIRLHNLSSMFLFPVSKTECSEIISSLKVTKQGINEIPVKLFIQSRVSFLAIICDMINTCFKLGSFPDVLKRAVVVAIHKKGDRSLTSNYRPIALLPFLSKVFERCIFKRISSFISKHNIISPSQFGFSKGKSTEDAVCCLTEHIYESLNSKNVCVNVFIDLRKAFDTINHKIVLRKLEFYGIRGLPLKLHSTYLTNRFQCVRFKTACSDLKPICIGLPQGSILAPILFLLFINDLPNISQNFKSILFADDTTLSFNHSNYTDLNTTCNVELKSFHKWTLANRLTLNVDKTNLRHNSYIP